MSINAEAPMSFVTAEYVDICLSGDDSRDVKRVSALCDIGMRFAWPTLLLWRD